MAVSDLILNIAMFGCFSSAQLTGVVVDRGVTARGGESEAVDRIQEREEHTAYGDSFQPRGVHYLNARIDLYHSPSKRVATLTLARITQICIAIL
jgi:hypothetical protein